MGAINSATFLSVQSSMFSTISAQDTSHASAIYTAQRQASIAAGIAILSTIVASQKEHPLEGFHHAYLAAADPLAPRRRRGIRPDPHERCPFDDDPQTKRPKPG